MSHRSDTPGRVRASRGYADVRRFLQMATQEELEDFSAEFSEEDKTLLEKFTRNLPRSASAERRGRPPRPVPSARTLFRILKGVVSTSPGSHRYTREALVKEFEHLGALLGGSSPFVGWLWDSLPGSYKGRRMRGSVEGKSPRSKTLKGGAAGRRGQQQRRKTRKQVNKPVAGFAVVHSKEKPWVKEPNYKRWLAKLKRHTAKVRRHGDAPNPVNMCLDSEICKGDLGIPRKLMPQFTTPRDIQSFMTFAEKRYGVKSARSTRKAGQLRPSQEEINRERVEDVADEIRYKKLDPKVPLIVSEDDYVIDGHHRWAAYKVDHPMKPLPVLVVKAPARDVLSIAATWGAKHHQF